MADLKFGAWNFSGIWDLAFGTSDDGDARVILSLNLGSQTVGLAEFRGQAAGGLVLHGFRMREILADPASESARNAQITTALARDARRTANRKAAR